MDFTGFVDADHHQFYVGGMALDEPDFAFGSGSVLSAGGRFCVISTGVAYGPVAVRVSVLEAAAPVDDLDEWDVVEEASIQLGGNVFAVTTLSGERSTGLDDIVLDAGSDVYVVRVSARGRDENWDMQVTSATEDYLIQLWPAETGLATGLRQLKKTDSVWPDESETTDGLVTNEDDAPFDSGLFQVFNEGGSNTFPDTKTGIDPSPQVVDGRYAGLRDSHPAVELRKLDPDLVDRILSLTDARQKSLTRWVVTRTLEMVGMTELPWIAEPLTLLNSGTIFPFQMRNPIDDFKSSGGAGIEEHWVDPIGWVKRSKERIAVGLLSGCEYPTSQVGLGALDAVHEATLAWHEDSPILIDELRKYLAS